MVDQAQHTKETLLPCPFCGSPSRGPHFHEWDRAKGGYWWIECRDECCIVESLDSEAAVVARWNRRSH
jgi:hypothetical protein